MADVEKDIVLRVKAESEQATGQFKNLKQELRSIEGELNRMKEAGDTGSKAFQELQKRAGQVKDQIGDTKSAIKALSSDTFKLDAFTQAAQGIAGGFAAAQGAMALFGSENQAVEQAIKKTQGAMALLQGVTAITNILQKETAFSQLFLSKAQKDGAVATEVATKATKGLGMALKGLGIGLLIGALTYLIANFEDVKKVVNNLLKPFDGIIAKVRDFLHTISFGLIDDASTAKTKENAEESLKAIEKVANYNKSMEKQLQRNIDLAKAKGKSDKEILQLEKELLDFRLKNNYAEQDAIKRKMALGTATDEEKKKLFELVESARDLVKDRETLDINYQKGVKKRNEESKEQAKKDAKEQRDFEDKERQLSLDADKKYLDDSLASDRLTLDKKLDLNKEYFLNGTISEKEYLDNINRLKKEQADKEAKASEDAKDAATEQREFEDKERQMSLDADLKYLNDSLESTRLSLEKKKELLKESYLNGIISEKEYQETIAGLDTKAFQIKQANINKWGKLTIDGLSALTELNNAFSKKDEASQRKAFERNKKFSIAQALISTFLAVNGALTAGGNPVKFATGAQFVEAGIALTMGLAQVAKISKTQFSGGGQDSGGGGGLGTIPTPSTMATQTAGLDATQLQLDAQGNLMQQRTMRTYVLETDISAKQQRSKRLQQTATLGK